MDQQERQRDSHRGRRTRHLREATTIRDRAAETQRRAARAPRRGVTFALVAAALFGVSAPVAKQLLDVVSPQLLAGLLYAGAGVGLAGVWLVRRGAAREAPLTPRDVPWLAGAIFCGGVVAPLLLMAGLARTPASTASLLLSLEGAFTAFLAWFVFREAFDRRFASGMASIFAGRTRAVMARRDALAGARGPSRGSRSLSGLGLGQQPDAAGCPAATRCRWPC